MSAEATAHSFIDKARVVLTSVPAIGGAVIAVLTTVATVLIPTLPASVQVQAAAYVASAIAAVTTVVGMVKRLTPAPQDQQGIFPPADPPVEA